MADCETPGFNHHDPARMQDPYPFYAAVRARCPYGHSDEIGGFFFSVSHASTKEVLSSYRQFTSREGVALRQCPAGCCRSISTRRCRPSSARCSTASSVEEAQAYRPTIAGVIDALVDDFIGDGTVDTTPATLNMTLLHLAHTPDDKQRLISGEIDWAGAIEEIVRYASPIQFLRRTVVAPVERDGLTLPAGAPVLAGIGAGNRDAQLFAEPDRCILTRDARDHLGFGSGAHVCLAAISRA